MNKTKKIAIAAVSLVMAGTMVMSIAGCTPSSDNNITPPTTNVGGGAWDAQPSTNATNFIAMLTDQYGLNNRVTNNAGGWTTAANYWEYLKNEQKTDTSAAANLSYTAGTEIGIAIGHNSADTGAFYGNVSGEVTLPDGSTATAKGLKPAMKAMQDRLNIKFVDGYEGKSTSANLGDLVTNNKWGSTVQIATSDLSKAIQSANNASNILNLGNYLDKMPNFKAFLEANPIVYLSLLQDGMNTTTGEGKKLYVAPYFDGNDDIERYCLIRQDWVVDLLDKDVTVDGDTYKAACGEATAVSGYMGTTGKIVVATTVEGDTSGATFDLVKDYDAALAAAKSESADLGVAYKAIANEAYAGSSGNIIDIMNAALEKNNEATGKQLITLYRAYIDVAYKKADGSKAYAKKSDLFNGYSAAWDVDDLVAILRIVKTSSAVLGLDSLSTTGIFPRDNSNDRTPDIIRLACQLYGERGADSRYEYTYIDKTGKLQDMRASATFYQALENFALIAKEGLIAEYVGANGGLGTISSGDLKGDCKNKPGTGFMMYDYSQTQTTQMYDLSAGDDYLFAPVNTPVSRWDDNADGKKETIMRFTESWRSTKTGGLTVAASVANDENKLNAVLTFIDFLYSNDGQILSTFGAQSTNGNTNPNGFWYGTEVTGVDIDTVATKVGGQYVVNAENQSKYFAFNGKLYTGELYKGKMTPKVTTALYESFTGTTGVNEKFSARGSFTNYARKVMGATLPMGVKDQSFENQLTATKAAEQASKVSVSLANGTIKHPELLPTANLWYTVVPTGLPLSTDQSSVINSSAQSNLNYMTGSKAGDSKAFYSIFHWIIFKGYEGKYDQQGVVVNF